MVILSHTPLTNEILPQSWLRTPVYYSHTSDIGTINCCSLGSHIMKESTYSTLPVPTTAVPIPLTLCSTFVELCKLLVCPLFPHYKWLMHGIIRYTGKYPQWLRVLGLRPRGLLIITSGIFTDFLNPWVNL